VGLDKQLINNGLAGYNGTLVGCAFSVFLTTPVLPAVLATVAGGAASALLVIPLKNAMGSVPQWTLSFNLVTLSVLGYMRPLAEPSADAAVRLASDLTLPEALCAPLVGISQIFVLNDPIAGGLILAGIAHYSHGCALHTAAGSTVGMATALAMGADANEIASGIWGYNPALSSLAVSVFFVQSSQSEWLSAGSAGASAVLFGGIKTAMGTPLTLPFCVVASGCHLMRVGVPGLTLAPDPHSPEKNKLSNHRATTDVTEKNFHPGRAAAKEE